MDMTQSLPEVSGLDTEIAHHIDQILQAASEHDNKRLQEYLSAFTFPDCESVDVLDPVTNRCPLHAAIAGCVTEHTNGESYQNESHDSLEEAGSETIQMLLENGAIWNQLDNNNETPGCLARRLGLDQIYQQMVDAGVRAEIILQTLEGYEKLGDEDDVEETTEELAEVESDETMTDTIVPDVNSSDYLSSTLFFAKDKLMDDQSNGVMMEWERDIMQKSAESIVDRSGLKVMNIGAGMLIFDSIVQDSPNKPESHHIVEAHPDVLADMRAKGWYEKPGVFIHEGRWQDVLPDLVAQNEVFDAIYFDTFAESYSEFRDFFQEQVIGLLSPEGKWSFFNGMGADRQISYDVYQKVAEVDLLESGFDVDWQDMIIPTLNKEWDGVKRKYWNVDHYRLPVCRFMG